MATYGIGQAIIFLSCGFFFLSFIFFLSSPILIHHRLDVYHTSTHGVALVQIKYAGLKRAACGSLKIQDAKKSPKICHLRTISGSIFATKARIDSRKRSC